MSNKNTTEKKSPAPLLLNDAAPQTAQAPLLLNDAPPKAAQTQRANPPQENTKTKQHSQPKAAKPEPTQANEASPKATQAEPLPDPNISQSHWAWLGVPIDASNEEVNKAFKKLARTYHPDKGGSAELFQHIKNAKDYMLDTPVSERLKAQRNQAQDAAKPNETKRNHADDQSHTTPSRQEPRTSRSRQPDDYRHTTTPSRQEPQASQNSHSTAQRHTPAPAPNATAATTQTQKNPGAATGQNTNTEAMQLMTVIQILILLIMYIKAAGPEAKVASTFDAMHGLAHKAPHRPAPVEAERNIAPTPSAPGGTFAKAQANTAPSPMLIADR